MTSSSRKTSRIRLCHVCGFSENEVDRLHCFPSKLERSKMWQINMGMVYAEETLQNHRICSRHFTADSYLDQISWRLRRNAVPTLFPCSFPQLEMEPEFRAQVKAMSRQQPEHEDSEKHLVVNLMPPKEVQLTPAPGTSRSQPCDILHSTSGMQGKKRGTQRHSVFRGIDNISKKTSSPRKVNLMNTILKKEDHIRKLKRMCKAKAHDLKALSNLDESSVVKNLFKHMPTTTANFLISQLRCAKRQPRGRRWSTEEKVVALSLLKRSPKCYKLLSKIVAMPSRRTLTNLLQKVPLNVGINKHLFVHINQSLKKEEDRICVITFDEVDIKENVQYDKSADMIIGFVDLGDHSGSKMANRALVFMCMGLARKWKQPVAYYFSNNGCSGSELVQCLKEVLHGAKHLGRLDIVATICDMGTSNVRAMKLLDSTIQAPYFEFEGEKIFTMFDPPHLLKCTASLFRKHNIVIPVLIGDNEELLEAKFSDIRKAYDVDKKTPLVFRSMPKIRDHHLAPIMRFAMKVNIAAQTLSRTVAAWLYALLTRGDIEQRAIATATFVQQVDELFDSFNGSTKEGPDGKSIKCAISATSPHCDYWSNAFNKVKNWNFQRKTKKGNLRTDKPPSQYGWMMSLRAIQSIWNCVKGKGLEFLRGRTLTQDGLENLFCMIRAGCGSSSNPTSVQFAASLKTQILNGLTNQNLPGANCEADEHELLTNLISFIDNRILDDIAIAVQQGSTCTLSVAYVSGFIAKAILKNKNCAVCKSDLCSQPSDLHNTFIMYKEWTDDQFKLVYPAENLVVLVGQAVTLLEKFLDTFKGRPEVARNATHYIIERVDFAWFTCTNHRDIVLQDILRGVCRIGIPWWCKRFTESQIKIKKDSRCQEEVKNS